MAVPVWNSHIAVAVASTSIGDASANRWSLYYSLDIAVFGFVSDEALKYNPRNGQIIKMRKESMSQAKLCMLGVEKRKKHIKNAYSVNGGI